MITAVRQSVNRVLYCLPVLFGGLLLTSVQAFAGSWSTEYNLEGMGSVHIYLPTTSPVENGKRALMINLHGCSMDNTDMKSNAGWKATADQFGMVVALPDVPNGGVNGSCWDYYGESHTRYNKYNNEVIGLAKELMGRYSLNIDPLQVYITGFSSGGGQANVIACLAPDIFSGVGSSAGPGLGTNNMQFGYAPWGYSDSGQAELCRDLAGGYESDLSTQLYSTIHGSSDSSVSPSYNTHGAEIMSRVYGADYEGFQSAVTSGGTEVIFSDATGPRVSRISVSGMGHDWPARDGGNYGYFVNTKVDYPNYVTQWFFDNNRRLPTGRDNDTGASSTWECVEYTGSNTGHYNASPQRASFKYINWQYQYYANGSGEKLQNTGSRSITTVAETSEGYFEAGSCP